MDIKRAIKDGVNWFLITANSVILFLSITSLEGLANNQSAVISAFEMGGEALSQNAKALEVGASTLEDFGTYMASSVLSAADAFNNFESILEKHLELARVQAEVSRRQNQYLQDFTQALFQMHLNGHSEGDYPFGQDNIDDMADLYGLSREECIRFTEQLSKIQREVEKENREAMKKRSEELSASAKKQPKNPKAPKLPKIPNAPTMLNPSNHASAKAIYDEVAFASYEAFADMHAEPDSFFNRSDFLFGSLSFEETRSLSLLCCIGSITDIAYQNAIIDKQLYKDIEAYLTPIILDEVAKLKDRESTKDTFLITSNGTEIRLNI